MNTTIRTFKVRVALNQLQQFDEAMRLNNKQNYDVAIDPYNKDWRIITFQQRQTFSHLLHIVHPYNVIIECYNKQSAIEYREKHSQELLQPKLKKEDNKHIIDKSGNIVWTDNTRILDKTLKDMCNYGMVEDLVYVKNINIDQNLYLDKNFILLLAKLKVAKSEERVSKAEDKLKQEQANLVKARHYLNIILDQIIKHKS